jgi:hypothetical protein
MKTLNCFGACVRAFIVQINKMNIKNIKYFSFKVDIIYNHLDLMVLILTWAMMSKF